MPVRRANCCTAHSTAGASPRLSSTADRSSVASLRTLSIMESISTAISWVLGWSRSRCQVGTQSLSENRSILSAVSACPSSSWISRAMTARSFSRAERSRAAKSRSWARERSSASAARICSVMSRAMDEMATMVPCASLMGETLTDTSARVPSFRSRAVPWWATGSPRRTRSSRAFHSATQSGGSKRDIGRPTTSTPR